MPNATIESPLRTPLAADLSGNGECRLAGGVGDPQNHSCDLTRSIPLTDDVSIVAEPGGPERVLPVLWVLSGRSQTLLTFLD